jgi:hypothetical protein
MKLTGLSVASLLAFVSMAVSVDDRKEVGFKTSAEVSAVTTSTAAAVSADVSIRKKSLASKGTTIMGGDTEMSSLSTPPTARNRRFEINSFCHRRLTTDHASPLLLKKGKL